MKAITLHRQISLLVSRPKSSACRNRTAGSFGCGNRLLQVSLIVSSCLVLVTPSYGAAFAGPTPDVPQTQSAEMKQLCGLIQKRLTLIEEVSKTKWNTKSSIEDAERERQILQDVAAKAESLGMSSTWVEHFFRMQIEASKVVEYQRFAEWHAENRGPFSATLDLKSEVRPRLDALSDALLKALHHNWKAISSATGAAQAESCRASDRFGLAFSVALTPLTDDSAETEAIFSQEIHTR